MARSDGIYKIWRILEVIWRIDFLDLAGSPLENVVTMDGRREEGGILIIVDAVCIVLGGGATYFSCKYFSSI